MRTQIKVLTLCAATLAAATGADARNQPRQERSNRKPAGFNCPVCYSPCINKASLQRQVHQRRFQKKGGPQGLRDFQAGPTAQSRQGAREGASQRLRQQARQREIRRFDFDGDGQLSHAEKAARRAYRDALDRRKGVQPNERPAPQPPIE